MAAHLLPRAAAFIQQRSQSEQKGRVVSGTGFIKFPKKGIKTCQNAIKLPPGVVLLGGRARKGKI